MWRRKAARKDNGMKKVTDRTTLMEFAMEAEEIINRYGWHGRWTHPYPNCPVMASKIIDDCKDYDRCTEGSKEYLILLAEGFRKILEAWVEYEKAPKVTVRIIKSGKLTQIRHEDLDMFEGLVEVVA